MEILKSNVVLKVVLRTKVEGESKPKETEVAVFWGQMGKEDAEEPWFAQFGKVTLK
jgi:hypothetical protein